MDEKLQNGVTQIVVHAQRSHNGFPIDGAMVGAGWHKPEWRIIHYDKTKLPGRSIKEVSFAIGKKWYEFVLNGYC